VGLRSEQAEQGFKNGERWNGVHQQFVLQFIEEFSPDPYGYQSCPSDQ
jgi:hypothetical protein